MKFKYYLEGAGWAHIDFEIEDIKLDYAVSYAMGDSLNELLEGIIWLLDEKKEYPLGIYYNDKNRFTWSINEEGSTVDFEFIKVDDKSKIQLIITQNREEPKCMYNGLINFNDFLNEVINSCSKILNTNGFIGYFCNWMDQRDFPITYFLIIKNYLNKNNVNISENELFTDDKYMSTIFKTILDKEIKIIKK